MPYLSHDWEAGARDKVSDRLNTVLKVTALVMLAGGVAVLWIVTTVVPHRVRGTLRPRPGRDAVDDDVLRLVFACCSLHKTTCGVPRKPSWPCCRLVIGLLLNMAIDFVLIPAWGLLGAVVATTIATAVALAVLYWINHRAGMRLERGMILLSIAPAALCGGVWCGTAVLLLICVLLPFSRSSDHARSSDYCSANCGQQYLSSVECVLGRGQSKLRSQAMQFEHGTRRGRTASRDCASDGCLRH